MKNLESRADALLSLCVALTYEISEHLRAAAIKIENSVIYFYYYFNGEISEEDQENFSCVTTNAISGFLNVTCDEFFIRKDFPEALPNTGIFAFSRDTPLQKMVPRSETLNYSLEIQAILSICQALFGKISSKLRAVGVNKTQTGLEVHFLLDKGAIGKDFSVTKDAAQVVVADFPEITVDVLITECSYPSDIPNFGRIAFRRKE